MEQPPLNEKFNAKDSVELRDALSFVNLQDAGQRAIMITLFLSDKGYSADQKAVNDLAINFHKLNPQNFKMELEKIAREN